MFQKLSYPTMTLALGFICASLSTTSFKAANLNGSGIIMLQQPWAEHFQHENGTLKIQSIIAHLDWSHSRHSQYLHSLTSNHKHQSAQLGIKRGVGHVVLMPPPGLLPAGAIMFGGQTFLTVFDTSTSNCIVDITGYDPQRSETAVYDAPFCAAVGPSAYVTGRVVQDRLWVAGLNVVPASLSWTRDRLAETNDNPTACLCGLARGGADPIGTPTFFESLVAGGALDHQIFTLKMNHQGESELTLGGLPLQGHSGAFFWTTTVHDSHLWKVQGAINAIEKPIILDSSSRFITVPITTALMLFTQLRLRIVDRRHETFGRVVFAHVPCEESPEISVTLGVKSIWIKGAALKMARSDGDGQCVLTVVGRDMNSDSVVAGLPFFYSAVLVFDPVGGRVAVADR
ncbi:hypothetical protein V8E36_001710, partial [Tilletia maclaganii]